jgi:hypothetical protein
MLAARLKAHGKIQLELKLFHLLKTRQPCLWSSRQDVDGVMANFAPPAKVALTPTLATIDSSYASNTSQPQGY